MTRPVVTDHALVRYLERVCGIDLDGYRREIEARTAHAVEVGACALISEGWRYVILNGRIVTIMSRNDDPPNRPPRPPRDNGEEDEHVSGAA